MTSDPSQVAMARSERYAQWEKASAGTCVALVIAALVSVYEFRPDLLVVAGPFAGGLAFFFSWRAALQERDTSAIAHAIVGLVVAMSSVVFAGDADRWVMFSQSFPWLGLGLFLPIWFARSSHPQP
ncbi:hypothetical protein [Methylibium rhizosphaerae]|uniref:hypothetical protein n=1 Tax=Methylibium rhizosphaerae TaxID=2570323 RepID=UPI001125F859|nr:hypothetical protein [Methylibium rhizosphaerae]